MGTSCIIRIKDKLDDKESYVTIYKHYDGYPQGIGLRLKEKFQNHNVVSGIGQFDTIENAANGMEDFAAQVVAFLKQTIGDVYLYHNSTPQGSSSYEYTLYLENEVLMINQFDCSDGIVINTKLSEYILNDKFYDGLGKLIKSSE